MVRAKRPVADASPSLSIKASAVLLLNVKPVVLPKRFERCGSLKHDRLFGDSDEPMHHVSGCSQNLADLRHVASGGSIFTPST